MLRSLLCSLAALAAFAGLTIGVAHAAPSFLAVDTVACGQAKDALEDAQRARTALPVDATNAERAAADQAVANAQAVVNAECVTAPPTTTTTVPPTSTTVPPTSTTPPPSSTTVPPPPSTTTSAPPPVVLLPVPVACNDLRTRQDLDREALRQAIRRINDLHGTYGATPKLTDEQVRLIREAYGAYDTRASSWRRLIGDRRLACRDNGGDTRIDVTITPAPAPVRNVVSCSACSRGGVTSSSPSRGSVSYPREGVGIETGGI